MTDAGTTIVALKTVTLVLGGMITYLSLKAYRRTGVGALRALALGFGMITLGSLVAGVVDQFMAIETSYALITESALTAIGFGVILYSLYAE